VPKDRRAFDTWRHVADELEAAARGDVGKPDEYQPVEGVEAEPLRGGAAQQDDLLPQNQDFGFERCARSE
jgi:hypothetical protein